MKNISLIKNENLKLSGVLAQKIKKGFVVEEVNDKLPFVVLSKKPTKVNHRLNFLISCATFGLWSIPWAYKYFEAKKERKIIIAIDEDGMPFEEKCYG
ncbi:hypothetical protein [Flavobacterium undicola]|uniref:hypothetical protein n=1 Tax=Flavobacterium undicola TaxID=1932779 RepID=UPI0013770763|nr:hypothetical protein [Flavobacterium undicola]MBA0884665.1 hypothetical protein [Flavobacterium undicola]